MGTPAFKNRTYALYARTVNKILKIEIYRINNQTTGALPWRLQYKPVETEAL